VGNGATVYFFLNKKQHERFLTGITTFKNTDKTVVVPLNVATKSIDDLKGKHSAIATIVGDPLGMTKLTATVDGDKLTLHSDTAATGDVKVAWIVDLQPENAIDGVHTA
jgi:hypothetical protein